MHLERDQSGMGAGKITARCMKDWMWLSGNSLDIWERKAIRHIDNVWFASRVKE